MKCFILAGGYGKRLWPLSSKENPKQFLKLQENFSLLQMSLNYCLSFIKKENIFIITQKQYLDITLFQIQEIESSFTEDNIILEPCPKSTTASVAFSLKIISEKNYVRDDEPIVIFPTDLFTKDRELFLDTLILAVEKHKDADYVIIGKRPLFPETSYGYIKTNIDGKVEKFIEKPSFEEAQILIKKKGLFWNMGVTIFTAQTFWRQLFVHQSALYHFFQKSINYIERHYNNLACIPIEYSLLQFSNNIYMVEFFGSWTDIGSWDRLFSVLEKDKNNCIISGKACVEHSFNSLIMATTKPILALGVKNLVIVEANNNILVSSLDHVFKLKKYLIKDNFLEEKKEPKSLVVKLSYGESYMIKKDIFEVIILVVLQGRGIIKYEADKKKEYLFLGEVRRIKKEEKTFIYNYLEEELIISLNFVSFSKEPSFV